MVIDCITYNGEKDIWDIRYNVLKDVVDRFIVIEFDMTFSGKSKTFYGKELFKDYDNVLYIPVKDNVWHKYKDMAFKSPNTEYGKGAAHWIEEFCQKEYIKDCLTHVHDEDIVFIGDVDEIWEPVDLRNAIIKERGKIELRVYSYFLNNRSSERFWGTVVGHYRQFKNKCLNHIRSQNAYHTLLPLGGWHFTSMGGVEEVRRKLDNSYTKETYYTDWVKENLESNITNTKDFLGRNFIYTNDESDWPQYLKDNKAKYAHLLRHQ